MSPAAYAAIALVCAIAGVFGVVVPVIPGSLVVGIGLLVWGIGLHTTGSWVVMGIGLALVLVGNLSSLVLTGRQLTKREIPRWPIVVGVAGALVGMFLIPGFGLFIGFVVALFVAELIRVKNARQAVSTSWATVKAVGIGMFLELTCALIATAVLTFGIIHSLAP